MSDFNRNAAIERQKANFDSKRALLIKENKIAADASEDAVKAAWFDYLNGRNSVGVPMANILPSDETLVIDDFTGRTLTAQDIANMLVTESYKVKVNGKEEQRNYQALLCVNKVGVEFNLGLGTFIAKVRDYDGNVHTPTYVGSFDQSAVDAMSSRQGMLKGQLEALAKLFSGKKVSLTSKRVEDASKGLTDNNAKRTTAICEFTFA